MIWLIGVHAFLGEVGAIAALLLFVEFLFYKRIGLKFCQYMASICLIFTTFSWFIGGLYYVMVYGKEVKPIIMGSEYSWAHSIFMELKEHIFLFLPFLCFLLYQNMTYLGLEGIKEKRGYLLTLSLIICLLGFSMAFMGYIISTSARLGMGVEA